MDDFGQNERKKPGGKEFSRWAMIFSTMWIIGMTFLKAFGKIELSMQDIVLSGLSVPIIWSPVYLSIWIDKIVRRPRDD